MDKFLLIDKPAGWTSFDVVAKIRSMATKKEGKKIRVGHTGTLDPFATGLLIILLGDATKKQDEFMKLDKEYEATLRLGVKSSTGDPEGIITENTEPKAPSDKDIGEVLKQFVGNVDQTPPAFSAIKIDGQRAYKLAREGKEVKLEARKVRIDKIEVLNYDYPKLLIQVKCSSGTYVRTLAEDIGQKLGTDAYLTDLRRTKIGEFDVKKAIKIEDIEVKL